MWVQCSGKWFRWIIFNTCLFPQDGSVIHFTNKLQYSGSFRDTLNQSSMVWDNWIIYWQTVKWKYHKFYKLLTAWRHLSSSSCVQNLFLHNILKLSQKTRNFLNWISREKNCVCVSCHTGKKIHLFYFGCLIADHNTGRQINITVVDLWTANVHLVLFAEVGHGRANLNEIYIIWLSN